MEQTQPLHRLGERASFPPPSLPSLKAMPSPYTPSSLLSQPELTELGRSEALTGAVALKAKGYTHFDVAYTSVLKRANDTLDIILKEIGQEGIPIEKDQALNERHYGDLQGLNKDDGQSSPAPLAFLRGGGGRLRSSPCAFVACRKLNPPSSLPISARAKFGEEQVHIWRRSFDVPPPNGESLELTSKRVLPYYEAHILPLVKAGKNVLVAAHGNSLRSLIMQLDHLTPEQILSLELATGVPIVYKLDGEGKVLFKEVLTR